MRLETNPVTQLQMQGANSKNRTIRIIVIKIVFHHGELVNVSQSESIEASRVSTASIILIMCLVKWVTLLLTSGIYVQHWVWIMAQVPPCAAVRISKADLFCKTTFLICAFSATTFQYNSRKRKGAKILIILPQIYLRWWLVPRMKWRQDFS